MGNKRIALWDNLKFILIVLVVVGHFTNTGKIGFYHSIFIFIYSFHMPLFIFWAGLFHKNEGFWKKALAFIGIYVLYELCIFGLQCVFGKKAELDMLYVKTAPWFMLAMAFYCVIGFLLHKVMEKKIPGLILIGSLAIFSLLAGYIGSLGTFLALSRVIVFLPYYLLGMYIDRKKLEQLAENKRLKITGLVVLAVWLVICIVFMETVYKARPYLLAMEPYPDDIPLGFLWRLGFYVSGPVFGFFMIMITPSSEIKPVTLWGSRTLQVYFWHRHILYAMKYSQIEKWFYSTLYGKVLWLILAVIITCILSLKVFKYPTELLMGFTRKKKD